MMTFLSVPFAKDSTDPKGLNAGDEREDKDTGKWFKFVSLDTDLTNNALAVGEVVIAMATANRGTNKIANGVDADPIPLGIAMYAAAESASTTVLNYCWLQISGRNSTVKKDGNAVTAGNCVGASGATAGACTLLADATAVTGALLKANLGFCLVAALAGDATVDVYLRGLR